MKKYLFVFLLICFYSMTTTAEILKFKPAANPKVLQTRLMESSQNIKTITSDFLQKKHLEYLDTVIEMKGKFWFKKKSTLRWEYTEPFKYIIVLSGDKFIIKDAEKRNEFSLESNAAFREVIQLVSGVVQGNLIQESKFVIKIFENDFQYLVKLTPRDKNLKEVLSEIEMYFNRHDLAVHSVKMVESDQDYTEITFINRKINEKIPDSVFSVQ